MTFRWRCRGERYSNSCVPFTLIVATIYSVIVSDVYARGLSRSWMDRVFDVRLSVCGRVQSLPRVRAALTEHPLRMLSIRKECVTPPLQPPSPVAQPPSPTSSSLSTVSSFSYSSPFQQHQPSWLSLSSSPLSPSSCATFTPQCKHHRTVTRLDYPHPLHRLTVTRLC